MRLRDVWSSGPGRRTEIEPGVLEHFPKAGYVLLRRSASIPSSSPLSFPILSCLGALNIVSPLDIDYVINGQSLESAAFGCWLCIKPLTQRIASAPSLKSSPSGEGSVMGVEKLTEPSGHQRTHRDHIRKSHLIYISRQWRTLPATQRFCCQHGLSLSQGGGTGLCLYSGVLFRALGSDSPVGSPKRCSWTMP